MLKMKMSLTSIFILYIIIVFSCFPVQHGINIAKDGHKYYIGGTEIDYTRGPKGLDINYECEGKCDKDEMIHNAGDILEIAQSNLEKNKYQLLVIRASRKPHGRGQVDSEVIYQYQHSGEWVVISKTFK